MKRVHRSCERATIPARPRWMQAAFLACLLSAPGTPVLADVYKWTDQDGKVHYSDTPPKDVERERVRIDGVTAPGRTDAGEPQKRPVRDQSGRDAAGRIPAPGAHPASAETAREQDLARERRCLDARRQLAVLQELRLPVYRDANGVLRAKWKYDTHQGTREYLDDAQRAAETRRARQQITKDCRDTDDAAAQTRARTEWIRSEYCAAARADLDFLEQPGSRVTAQELEEMRQRVERYCAPSR